MYNRLYNLDYFILRFYNIYGENSRKGAVYLFTKAALNNETATVYGDGTHVRDYLYVGDVVNLINSIINNEIIPGEYEVGSGKGTSVNELIKLIETVTRRKIKYVKKDYVVEEADNLVARNTVIKNPLPLKNGIEKVIKCIENSTLQ
ncbi:NAD-dependent epimerase/dehydratase family protein [Acidiplasma sp.]|uniref:NAD-dependent epimerase/dehydratase family protein n=1 Tax=Acidiplasma sp. TaxID=1872114 RepID=UPI00338F7B9C